MTQEEMYARLLCLERSVKKSNYRIYLLEKKKEIAEESKKYFDNRIKSDGMEQLTLFEDFETKSCDEGAMGD
jgi:hypothetical protein